MIVRVIDLPLESILTGVTNATSESLDRLAKLEARVAYGFRDPASQCRSVRMPALAADHAPATSTTRRSASRQLVPIIS